MTPTTLVLAASASAREAAIAEAIAEAIAATTPQPAPPPEAGRLAHAALLEGMPDGHGQLETIQQDAPNTLALIRIAPGCLCCIGNVVLRVSINRLLRQRPRHLWISLATTTHLDQLRALLQSPPFDTSLQLTPDLLRLTDEKTV